MTRDLRALELREPDNGSYREDLWEAVEGIFPDLERNLQKYLK